MLDLHTHSTESDGSLTPEQVIDHAVDRGISRVALCDHDTTAGTARFTAYGADKGVEAIAGVEVSATWPKGNCHILGLGVRNDYGPLEEVLRKIRDSRDRRNEMIVAKLNELGVDVTLEEVESLAGGEVVARPHMARVMVTKGIVASVQEAFDKYLAKGAPAYVDRYRLDPDRAVLLLKEAGARVILAHPSQLRLEPEAVDELVGELKPHGLEGIEVYTPYTTGEQLPRYTAIARKHDLAISGGSDFHGESKPTHFMGYYRENVPIPEFCGRFLG
ncbi:MAG: PHP domain-containing protein [Chitinivibrionales bacterium]|nr:PHP domain-containing protein [Chitinivibrionales bacterium]MBD3356622.1 PHP domain-containing protein [Chitinivibrionales bacterium]